MTVNLNNVYLTKESAAVDLGISLSTLNSRIKAGKIQVIKVAPRKTFIVKNKRGDKAK